MKARVREKVDSKLSGIPPSVLRKLRGTVIEVWEIGYALYAGPPGDEWHWDEEWLDFSMNERRN